MSIMPQKSLFSRLFAKQSKKPNSHDSTKANAKAKPDANNIESPCCLDSNVHIAYRGVSDDRLYLAYDRKWQEVKYYKPKNLRVFCAHCRRRIC